MPLSYPQVATAEYKKTNQIRPEPMAVCSPLVGLPSFLGLKTRIAVAIAANFFEREET